MKRAAPKKARPILPELGRALTAAVAALDALRLPYALVGGLAVGAWGVARATRDVDLYAALAGSEDALQAALESRGFRVPALREELERFGVFRSRSADGVFVDIFSAVGALGAAVLEHRVQRVVRGRKLWFVAAEELVLLKAFSDRRATSKTSREPRRRGRARARRRRGSSAGPRARPERRRE